MTSEQPPRFYVTPVDDVCNARVRLIDAYDLYGVKETIEFLNEKL